MPRTDWEARRLRLWIEAAWRELGLSGKPLSDEDLFAEEQRQLMIEAAVAGDWALWQRIRDERDRGS